MPWIFNEDAALKHKLQGITVTDANAPAEGRRVAVRYRLPETELGELTFPIIVIEHSNIGIDHSREHRGHIKLPYAPEGNSAWWGQDDTSFNPAESPYYSDFPIPYNFDYQVTVMTRKWLHMLSILTELGAQSRIPERFGALEVPQDSTVRSMYLMGGPEASYRKDEDDKMLFTCTYMVRVATEYPPTLDVYYRVKYIHYDFWAYTNFQNDPDRVPLTPPDSPVAYGDTYSNPHDIKLLPGTHDTHWVISQTLTTNWNTHR